MDRHTLENLTAPQTRDLVLSNSPHILQKAQETLRMLLDGGEDKRLPATIAISGKDITAAIELAMKMDDYLQRATLRRQLRSSLVQAASVLAGTIQEGEELGEWADNLQEGESYGDRAAAFLTAHRSIYE